MDYLRRLLLRSLAVPREQGSPVFDPFAQVAAWELDAAAPQPQERAAEPPDARLPPPAAQRPEAVAAPMRPVPAPAFDVAAPAAVESMEPPTPGHLAPPLPETPVPPAPRDNAPAPPPERELLTQADAFMRSLGMKSVVAPEEPAPRPGPAAPSVPAPSPLRRTAPAPHMSETAGPVLVRPTVAPASEPARVPSIPRRTPDAAKPAAASAAAPAPQGAPSGTVPPQRIVQTTVVVATAGRGLDDLAHSSGISRFGLGQG